AGAHPGIRRALMAVLVLALVSAGLAWRSMRRSGDPGRVGKSDWQDILSGLAGEPAAADGGLPAAGEPPADNQPAAVAVSPIGGGPATVATLSGLGVVAAVSPSGVSPTGAVTPPGQADPAAGAVTPPPTGEPTLLARQAADYDAHRAKSVLELQKFRRTSSIPVRG